MNIYIYIISGPKKIESFVSVDGLLPVKFNVSNECRLQQSEERERDVEETLCRGEEGQLA